LVHVGTNPGGEAHVPLVSEYCSMTGGLVPVFAAGYLERGPPGQYFALVPPG